MPTESSPQPLGVVVEGSLSKGLHARLSPHASVEDVRAGSFVRVAGEKHDFFCLVVDVELGATNQQVLQDPPPLEDRLLRDIVAGTSTFGTMWVQPVLMLPKSGVDEVRPEEIGAQPRPVKTIPVHFAPAYLAEADDFARVFGEPGDTRFAIGQPLDMDVPVCVDLRRFVERSNGIFGKSGTGKSFLTRLALAGVIQTGVAVNLVFDMHSEYGWDSKTEEGTFVKGLRQLFGTRVVVYTLDPDSARRRSVSPDGVVTIGLDEIEVEDVALLQDELQLNPTAVEEANLCVDRFGREWIASLLAVEGAEGIKELAEAIGGHPQALAALRRKLLDLQRLPFVQEKADRSVVDELVGHLEAGRHVVLEFGQHRRLLPYILVANILTRRIHRLWVEKTERYLRSKDEADRPRHLIITVEEAHRFLNPRVSRQTTFGTIARELRKFNVTLLVVDQRPSGIDPEVLSQLGTRISAQLNDEDDIRALLTGMPNADRLRTVLASLESRQQALVLGHAVPMPVVVRTRTYDDAFYREVALPGTHVPAGRVRTYADIEREIYGDP